MTPAALLTVPEVAVYLRGEDTESTREFVRKLIRDGKLRARKEGRAYYVTHAAIERYLDPHGTTVSYSLAPAQIGRSSGPRRSVG